MCARHSSIVGAIVVVGGTDVVGGGMVVVVGVVVVEGFVGVGARVSVASDDTDAGWPVDSSAEPSLLHAAIIRLSTTTKDRPS